VVILVCAAALIGLTGSAIARPGNHHHRGHAVTAAGPARSSAVYNDDRHASLRNDRARGRGGRTLSARRHRAAAAPSSAIASFSGNDLVAEARKYLGTNPTDRKRLWCATFVNFILAKLGYAGTNSDAAKSFAYYGRRVSEPRVGAIAVLTRGKRGGHVGVVSGIDANGNPIIISGNHNRRVGIGIYPRSRVIAYVMPTKRYAPATRLAVRGAESGIDSPITELLATINAEMAQAEARASAREAAQSVQARYSTQPTRLTQLAPSTRSARSRRVVQRVRPYRLVQQTPDQDVSHYPPLDPALARFLGIRSDAYRQHARR
jgi:uncharacterized protein (TIGR02594 family)